ncbi:hypothetical protein SAMN06272781_7534 [Streptomyces sp. 1222.2]|nr:hypothetical protein SAMN06272781_7534 [Streptomyces sp. 1222.2]
MITPYVGRRGPPRVFFRARHGPTSPHLGSASTRARTSKSSGREVGAAQTAALGRGREDSVGVPVEAVHHQDGDHAGTGDQQHGLDDLDEGGARPPIAAWIVTIVAMMITAIMRVVGPGWPANRVISALLPTSWATR